MPQQLELIGKIVAVAAGLVALLGLPKIVPTVKRFWQRREINGILKGVESRLKQEENDAAALNNLHAACLRAYRKCVDETFLREEKLARELLQDLTETRLALVGEALEKSLTRLQLHELTKVCNSALQTAENNHFESLEDQARELLELLRCRLHYPTRIFFVGCSQFDKDLYISTCQGEQSYFG